MLKTLLLLRHGKTHRGGYTRDWDRELKGRGVAQARHIGGYLKKTGLVPDRIITSSAVRARATAEICAQETEYPEPVDARDELYNIDDSSLIEFITGLDNSLDRVLLVGHNPAFDRKPLPCWGGKSTPWVPATVLYCASPSVPGKSCGSVPLRRVWRLFGETESARIAKNGKCRI